MDDDPLPLRSVPALASTMKLVKNAPVHVKGAYRSEAALARVNAMAHSR